MFAIFIFVLVLAVLAVVGIFIEKLRVALLGAGACMLVTVALFVVLAPRASQYDDGSEAIEGDYNVLGKAPGSCELYPIKQTNVDVHFRNVCRSRPTVHLRLVISWVRSRSLWFV